jgi:hypothetical protein
MIKLVMAGHLRRMTAQAAARSGNTRLRRPPIRLRYRLRAPARSAERGKAQAACLALLRAGIGLEQAAGVQADQASAAVGHLHLDPRRSLPGLDVHGPNRFPADRLHGVLDEVDEEDFELTGVAVNRLNRVGDSDGDRRVGFKDLPLNRLDRPLGHG